MTILPAVTGALSSSLEHYAQVYRRGGGRLGIRLQEHGVGSVSCDETPVSSHKTESNFDNFPPGYKESIAHAKAAGGVKAYAETSATQKAIDAVWRAQMQALQLRDCGIVNLYKVQPPPLSSIHPQLRPQPLPPEPVQPPKKHEHPAWPQVSNKGAAKTL